MKRATLRRRQEKHIAALPAATTRSLDGTNPPAYRFSPPPPTNDSAASVVAGGQFGSTAEGRSARGGGAAAASAFIRSFVNVVAGSHRVRLSAVISCLILSHNVLKPSFSIQLLIAELLCGKKSCRHDARAHPVGERRKFSEKKKGEIRRSHTKWHRQQG